MGYPETVKAGCDGTGKMQRRDMTLDEFSHRFAAAFVDKISTTVSGDASAYREYADEIAEMYYRDDTKWNLSPEDIAAEVAAGELSSIKETARNGEGNEGLGL
jgi:hypothetical protein